jgi:hypothetical protein
MPWSAHGVTSIACKASIRGEEHFNSQTPTSQFGEDPRSMGRDNFTVKSACLWFSSISRDALLNSDVKDIG